jgi:hypothetical protein
MTLKKKMAVVVTRKCLRRGGVESGSGAEEKEDTQFTTNHVRAQSITSGLAAPNV